MALSLYATRSLRLRRHVCLTLVDTISWAAAIGLAAWSRANFEGSFVRWSHLLLLWVALAMMHEAVASLAGLHTGRFAIATLEEMLTLGSVVGIVGLSAFFANLFLRTPWVNRSVPLMATFLALVLMSWVRAVWRRGSEHRRRRGHAPDAQPVLVFGAGEAGRQLIRSILENEDTTWSPAGLLDDDPAKAHLRLSGVPVRGTGDDIARVAELTGAKVLVVATTRLDAARMRDVTDRAIGAGLRVKVVPSVSELLGDRIALRDVRDLHMEDLLGRREIATDIGGISGCLTGRRILVTGAGGSIGSELCRQLAKWQPAELVMLDRDESALHSVQLSLYGRAMLDEPDVLLADIRDAQAVHEIFARRRPDIVFHAAALKHLPMLEQYPGEAVKTNVLGTLTVLEAAAAAGVERFVNISTDKAADPISVLGYSKRIGERLTSHVAARADGTFVSVRFGNVLGSRGSVLTAFLAQVANGGPVTVTSPDVTRFFMTVQEAVQLLIQAAAIGRDGEALVLDMGEPVCIADVARQLIRMSGKDVAIEYTGLRGGEKVEEVLFGDGEIDSRPIHPLVSHVSVPPIRGELVRSIDPYAERGRVLEQIAATCGLVEDLQELGL